MESPRLSFVDGYQPLPTLYKNITFRSQLEARWATFFDCLRVEWQYEPGLQRIGAINYMPDFWLPDYESFVEIKPTLHGERIEKPIALATKFNVVVMAGQPYEAMKAWWGWPNSPALITYIQLGICTKCISFMVVASFHKIGLVSVLAPKSSCNHRFVRNPHISAWDRAFIRSRGDRLTAEAAEPFSIEWIREELKRL